MTDKNKITVPVTNELFLVYRTTNMTKSVLLVRRVETKGSLVSYDEAEQFQIATSAPGCMAVSEALKDMADKIR